MDVLKRSEFCGGSKPSPDYILFGDIPVGTVFRAKNGVCI